MGHTWITRGSLLGEMWVRIVSLVGHFLVLWALEGHLCVTYVTLLVSLVCHLSITSGSPVDHQWVTSGSNVGHQWVPCGSLVGPLWELVGRFG